MKTYIIYKATFSGSNDHMAHAVVSIAAINITQAVKEFKKWDNCTIGQAGRLGNLIYKDENNNWVRPSEIKAEHITKCTDLRATSRSWWNVK